MTTGVMDPPATPAGAGTDGLYAVLTPAGAAEYLQVSEAALVTVAEAGELPGRKIGGQWRFLKFALAEWLRQGRPRPASPPVIDETPEEQEAFLARLRDIRREWGTVGGDAGEASG